MVATSASGIMRNATYVSEKAMKPMEPRANRNQRSPRAPSSDCLFHKTSGRKNSSWIRDLRADGAAGRQQEESGGSQDGGGWRRMEGNENRPEDDDLNGVDVGQQFDDEGRDGRPDAGQKPQ